MLHDNSACCAKTHIGASLGSCLAKWLTPPLVLLSWCDPNDSAKCEPLVGSLPTGRNPQKKEKEENPQGSSPGGPRLFTSRLTHPRVLLPWCDPNDDASPWGGVYCFFLRGVGVSSYFTAASCVMRLMWEVTCMCTQCRIS